MHELIAIILQSYRATSRARKTCFWRTFL